MLNDDGKACRKLAIYYRKKGEKELSRELFKKVVLLGDEKAFFASGKKCEDWESYVEMLKDYEMISNKKQKRN